MMDTLNTMIRKKNHEARAHLSARLSLLRCSRIASDGRWITMDYSWLLGTDDWQQNLHKFCGQAAFCIAAVLQHSSNLGDWKAWHIDHSHYRNPDALPYQKRGTNRTARQRPAFASMRLPCHSSSWLKSHLTFGNDVSIPNRPSLLSIASCSCLLGSRCLAWGLWVGLCSRFPFHKFWEAWKTNAFKHLRMNTVLHMWARLSWHLHVTIRLATWLFLLWLFLLIFVILFRDGEWQAHQPARTLRDSMSSSSATSAGTMSSSKMFQKNEKNLSLHVTGFRWHESTNTDTMMLNNVTLWFTLGGRWKASENVMMQYHGWR